MEATPASIASAAGCRAECRSTNLMPNLCRRGSRLTTRLWILTGRRGLSLDPRASRLSSSGRCLLDLIPSMHHRQLGVVETLGARTRRADGPSLVAVRFK